MPTPLYYLYLFVSPAHMTMITVSLEGKQPILTELF